MSAKWDCSLLEFSSSCLISFNLIFLKKSRLKLELETQLTNSLQHFQFKSHVSPSFSDGYPGHGPPGVLCPVPKPVELFHPELVGLEDRCPPGRVPGGWLLTRQGLVNFVRPIFFFGRYQRKGSTFVVATGSPTNPVRIAETSLKYCRCPSRFD